MENNFASHEKIVVSQEQAMLHSSSVITQGEFITARGDKALVLLEGEEIPREVPLSAVASSNSLLGDSTDRRGESVVIDLSPRTRYF